MCLVRLHFGISRYWWVMCYCRDDAQSAQGDEGELLCSIGGYVLWQRMASCWNLQKNKRGYVSLKLFTCLKKVEKKKKKSKEFMCFLWCLLSIHLDKNNSVKCKQSWSCHCLPQIKVLTTNGYMTPAGAEHADILEGNDGWTRAGLLCCGCCVLRPAGTSSSGTDNCWQSGLRPSLREPFRGFSTSLLLDPASEGAPVLKCHKELATFSNLEVVGLWCPESWRGEV